LYQPENLKDYVMPDTIKAEFKYRDKSPSWGYRVAVYRENVSRWDDREIYVSKSGCTYYGSGWDWCFSEKRATKKCEKRYKAYYDYKAKEEQIKAKNEEMTKKGFELDPDVPPVTIQSKIKRPDIPLVSSFSPEEQHKRLRFGKTLIARPEKFATGLDGTYGVGKVVDPSDQYPANVLVSDMGDGTHAFCVDIDMPCELVQSKTPGHYHLYIDKILSEESYWTVLQALADAGIVQQGYVAACKDDGMTILRLPPGHDTFEKLKAELAEDPDWAKIG
jgi:hypothetical protein